MIMKSIIGALASFLFTLTSWSQLSGDVVDDKRKMTSDKSFVLEGNHNGKIAFNISVNAKGEISGIKILEGETTIKSTPSKIKARNYVSKFKFEPGTWFPKHHQGKIVITMVEPK